MSKKTKEAIAVLQGALKDADYLESWKSSIVMAMMDANTGTQLPAKKLHTLANKGADLFLKRLMT